jgi:hypothetical protein
MNGYLQEAMCSIEQCSLSWHRSCRIDRRSKAPHQLFCVSQVTKRETAFGARLTGFASQVHNAIDGQLAALLGVDGGRADTAIFTADVERVGHGQSGQSECEELDLHDLILNE